MKALITRILHPKNYISWLIYFLLINSIHLLIFHNQLNREEGKLFNEKGDASQYIGATESLLKEGEMTFMKTNDQLFYSNLQPQNTFDLGVYYAFRTPGLNFFHYPLRLVFDYDTSLNLMILFQVLLNVIAKYLFCFLLYKITMKKWPFFFLVIVLTFSIYLSFFNNFIMTESLSVSFLIFFTYAFFYLFNKNASKVVFVIFLSGIFITIAYCLRPFLGPLIFVFAGIIFFNFRNNRWKLTLLFLLPLIVFKLYWIPRNYIKTGDFIPIAATMRWKGFTNLIFKEHHEISNSLSKAPLWWVNESPLYWLEKEEDTRSPIDVFGKDFFVNISDTSNLVKAKKMYHKSKDTLKYNLSERIIFEKKGSVLVANVHNNYKETNTFLFLTKRIKTLVKFFDLPLTKPLISVKYPYNVISVLLESLFFRFLIIFGLIGMFFILKNQVKKIQLAPLYLIPIYIVFLFAIVYAHLELREMFIPLYFLAFCSVLLVFKLLNEKKVVNLFFLLLPVFFYVGFDMITKITW